MNFKMKQMQKLIQVFLILFLISCQNHSSLSESEKKLIGKYRQSSATHFEILKLKNDYKLETIYHSRRFKDGKDEIKFYESGEWTTSSDTLILHRDRNEILKKFGYPEKQIFLIRDNKLIELEMNYKEELIEMDCFEKK
jgi:hypothetical protein